MKDWKERFDERFVANLPMSGIHLKDSTGNILDYSDIIIGEMKDFIEQIISERDKELIESVEKMKLLEVGVDSNSVMWKQRINKNLENIINLIKTK